MIEVDIGNGAARVEDWFKVESFIVEERTYGETSYQREVSPNETVVIDIYVRDTNGNVVQANATLLYLKRPMDWDTEIPPKPLEDSPGVFTNFSATDATGRATLKLKAPETNDEYIAMINVTTGTDSTMSEAWFRVMAYSVNVQMMCADGTNNCNDPHLKSAGGNVIVKVEVTGDVNVTRACLREIRNIYTNTMTSYWQCNDTQGIVNNSNEVIINFMAPMETGEYDAVIIVEVDMDGSGYYEHAKEEWRWFRVMGEGGYEMNAWIEPHSIWPGTNASAYVELWNPMQWEDVKEDEICSSINITEIRDTYTWTVVKTGSQITQWIEEQEMCGGMPCGPPGVQLKFEVPYLSPGEYEAKIVAECEGTTYQRNSWFQINVFQVSSLMPGKVKANQTVPVWLKVTAYNGTPLTNVDVNIKEIRNDWTWDIVRTINVVKNPNDYGEVEYNLTTPEQSGQYILEMEVVDQSSGLMQRVSRWFRIAGMNVVINISGRSEFYAGEDVNITIDVTDAMTGGPIENAGINIDVWGHAYSDMDKSPQGNETNETTSMGGPGVNIQLFDIFTDENGTAYANISKDQLKAGEYGLGVNVCTDTKGCSWIEESFVVNNYYLYANLTGGIDYNVGDVINVLIQANYTENGPSLNSSFKIEACLENMMMKGPEEDESQDKYNCTNKTLNDNGFAQLEITVPLVNVSSGPGVLFVELLNSTDDYVGWMPYLVILHAEGGVNYTFDKTGESDMLEVGSSEMFGVSLSMSNPDAQMSQSVMHIKKTGDSVPMSQMMGGGPESNKEDWYESAMFLNATGDLHMKVLSREEPGIYYSFLAFNLKGSGMMMGPENILDVAFLNYRVI